LDNEAETRIKLTPGCPSGGNLPIATFPLLLKEVKESQ